MKYDVVTQLFVCDGQYEDNGELKPCRDKVDEEFYPSQIYFQGTPSEILAQYEVAEWTIVQVYGIDKHRCPRNHYEE